jgi:hypothetical protein
MPKPKATETDSSNTFRDEKGRYLTGNSGGGRPRGARSKLGEQFIEALAADFEQHGETAIEVVRKRDTTAYLKIIKDILPREILVRAFAVNASVDITNVEEARAFLRSYRLLRDTPRETIDHVADGALVTPVLED